MKSISEYLVKPEEIVQQKDVITGQFESILAVVLGKIFLGGRGSLNSRKWVGFRHA